MGGSGMCRRSMLLTTGDMRHGSVIRAAYTPAAGDMMVAAALEMLTELAAENPGGGEKSRVINSRCLLRAR